MKPVNPYSRLKKEFQEYFWSVTTRKVSPMWHYPIQRLSDGDFDLRRLYERVAAASQLGYETRLRATERGLEVEYVERLPPRPSGTW